MLSQNSQQSSLELKIFSTFAIRRGPYCVLTLSAVRQFMNIDRDIQGWVNPRPVSHCAVSMFSQMSLKVFNSRVYPSLDNSPRMYASCSSWAAVGLSSPLTQPCLFALPRDNTDSWGPPPLPKLTSTSWLCRNRSCIKYHDWTDFIVLIAKVDESII